MRTSQLLRIVGFSGGSVVLPILGAPDKPVHVRGLIGGSPGDLPHPNRPWLFLQWSHGTQPARCETSSPTSSAPTAGTDPTGPAAVLRANGHPDLPDDLVAEAVGSYADTAPIEVAEHLSPYVMAHSPVPQPDAADVDPADWFDAVTTAPVPDGRPVDRLDGLDRTWLDDGAAARPRRVRRRPGRASTIRP